MDPSFPSDSLVIQVAGAVGVNVTTVRVDTPRLMGSTESHEAMRRYAAQTTERIRKKQLFIRT